MITRLLPCLLLLVSCTVLTAQQRRVNAPERPLDSLNDEFNSAATLSNWQQWHTVEGQPDKWKTATIKNGILDLQPYASGWYGDYQAPFMFKTIAGDFDVTVKLKVSGEKDALPQTEWSLAGLMVRQPSRPGAAWEPRQQNWLFLTTGIAEPKGVPMLEAKTTNNSISNLKLRPAKAGWVELRIIRVNASFILLHRFEGEKWTVSERFYRPLLPYQLQVGINAYTGWNVLPQDLQSDPALHNKSLLKDLAVDMLVQVEYVHFARPKLNSEKLSEFLAPGFQAPYYQPGNLLTDYAISNKDLLEVLSVL